MIVTEPETVVRRYQFSLQSLLLFPASFAIAIGFAHGVSDLAFRAMYPILGMTGFKGAFTHLWRWVFQDHLSPPNLLSS
jgi:hypothetical protein